MKRKQFITAFVPFMLIFVMAGCSNSSNSSSQSTSTTNNSNGTAVTASKNNFSKPDVYGEVSKIDGRSVTLKLLKFMHMPSKNSENGQNTQNGQNSQNGDNGSFRRGGAGGLGGMRQKQYTGKEKTITIPTDASVVTMTRGDNGMVENKISLSDIKTGSTLSVYYKKDGKTIDKIRVMQPRTDGGQGSTQGNGQSNGQSANGNV